MPACHEIEAGVSQGNVIGPILYTLFTADFTLNDDKLTATFADDTAILVKDRNPDDSPTFSSLVY